MNAELIGDTGVVLVVGTLMLKSAKLKDNLVRVEGEKVTESVWLRREGRCRVARARLYEGYQRLVRTNYGEEKKWLLEVRT